MSLPPVLPSPEEAFLRPFFSLLDTHAVRYAVMRNYAPLPFSTGGSDLDILVSEVDGERAEALCRQAAQLAGGVPIGLAQAPGFFKMTLLGKEESATASWWGVCLDINTGLRFRGLRLLAPGVEWPLQRHNGIAVLDEGVAGVLGVLKEALNNGVFAERYADAARRAVHTNWDGVKRLLAPMGEAALATLRAVLLSQAAPMDLRASCRRLRQEVIRHAILRQPLHSLVARLSYEWSKVRRYLRPSGVVMAVLGVDGAGKSTVINAVRPVLDAAVHGALAVQHLRPTVLPPLARLKGGAAQPRGPVMAPHSSRPSGVLGSLFRLVYLTLDYVVGYWLWTRPKIAKQPTVVIFDRYAYDMGLDPRRFRIGISAVVAGWFARCAARPDIIICLHGDPGRIVARKQELSLEETAQQIAALRQFARHESRAVLVATDGSVDESRDQVLCGLRTMLLARAGKA